MIWGREALRSKLMSAKMWEVWMAIFLSPLHCQLDGWQMEYLQFNRSKNSHKKAYTCQVSIAKVALFDEASVVTFLTVICQLQNLHLKSYCCALNMEQIIEAWENFILSLTDYPPLSENLSTKWPLWPNFLHLAHLNFLNYSTAFFPFKIRRSRF